MSQRKIRAQSARGTQADRRVRHCGPSTSTAWKTNILYVDVDPVLGATKQFCERLHDRGVRVHPVTPQCIRALTHLDVNTDDIEHAIRIMQDAPRR